MSRRSEFEQQEPLETRRRVVGSVTDVMRSNQRLREGLRLMRTAYWRWRYGLRHIDPTFLLSRGCSIHEDFETGAHGFMNEGCRIGPRVRVGNYVLFGPEVSFVGADHRFDKPGIPISFSGRPQLEPTTIEDDVWLGARSIIMAGVTIGRGSIVGAGSIVTRDLPAYSIAVGSPAKVVRYRFEGDEQSRHDRMLAESPRSGTYVDPK